MAGATFDDPNRESVRLAPISTGARDGGLETWTPRCSSGPASVPDLLAGRPNTIPASPATPWTSGQYVQTMTSGAAGRATWTGTAWVGGAAPPRLQSRAA